jgi:cyclase
MCVTRREFLFLSSGTVILGPRLLFAQTPQTSFESLRGNAGIFSGKGGTIGWLSNKDALIVIDSQFPDTAQICADGLKQKAGRGVDILINTHHHGDHTGGNAVFKDAKKHVAHRNVPDLQRKAAPSGQADMQIVATTLFDKDWTESAGGERITAKHYGPGHTGGDCVIHFQQANVVHMGDLLFNEMHPFIDRPAGASIQNWIKTLDAVAKEYPADAIYIAGHAKKGLPVTGDRTLLRKQRDYLDAVLTYAMKGIAEKKSRDEITKAAALPGFEGHMEIPPRLTLTAALGVAYDELTAK